MNPEHRELSLAGIKVAVCFPESCPFIRQVFLFGVTCISPLERAGDIVLCQGTVHLFFPFMGGVLLLTFQNQLRRTLQFAKINIIREKIDVLKRRQRRGRWTGLQCGRRCLSPGAATGTPVKLRFGDGRTWRCSCSKVLCTRG